MTDEPKDPGTAPASPGGQSESPAKPPPDTSWLQTTEVREGDQRREKRNG
jgi:hypothetical protein